MSSANQRIVVIALLVFLAMLGLGTLSLTHNPDDDLLRPEVVEGASRMVPAKGADIHIHSFEDSWGRVCTFAYKNGSGSLDCNWRVSSAAPAE